jgi:hypothetical protein
MENLSTTETPVLCLEQTSFSVTFSWQESNLTVKLDKGDDVLKLAKIFSDFLTNNGIPNTIINKNK